jgi:hypothetical protein
MPPPTMSSIVNRTRSQPLSLLSMARLNMFQGARRQGEMGFSVVMVVSDAGPVHLSAGSPSTGCDNLPGKHAIAPKTVISRAHHTLPGSPPDLRRFPAPTTRTVAAPRTLMTPANTKWAYQEITYSDRNADADHWHELPR